MEKNAATGFTPNSSHSSTCSGHTRSRHVLRPVYGGTRNFVGGLIRFRSAYFGGGTGAAHGRGTETESQVGVRRRDIREAWRRTWPLTSRRRHRRRRTRSGRRRRGAAVGARAARGDRPGSGRLAHGAGLCSGRAAQQFRAGAVVQKSDTRSRPTGRVRRRRIAALANPSDDERRRALRCTTGAELRSIPGFQGRERDTRVTEPRHPKARPSRIGRSGWRRSSRTTTSGIRSRRLGQAGNIGGKIDPRGNISRTTQREYPMPARGTGSPSEWRLPRRVRLATRFPAGAINSQVYDSRLPARTTATAPGRLPLKPRIQRRPAPFPRRRTPAASRSSAGPFTTIAVDEKSGRVTG